VFQGNKCIAVDSLKRLISYYTTIEVVIKARQCPDMADPRTVVIALAMLAAVINVSHEFLFL
jgi:hypothetical protein